MPAKSASATRLNSADRRAAIVHAAIQLFSERGFRGTTTRELAAVVGVSEPVLYQHFATKRDLYAAIIDSKSQDGVARFAEWVQPYMEGSDDRAFFERVAELILTWYEEDPTYIRLLFYSALEGHELADLFFERQSCAFAQALTSYMDRRRAEGAFREIDPKLMAESLMGMVAHCGLSGAIFKRRELAMTKQQLAAGMVNIFLEGVKQ